jgi:acetyl esterase/lipase
MSFRLWPDEIEAMRPEARLAVDNMGAAMPRADITPGMSRDERVAAQRATHLVPPEWTVAEAVDREIAGVRCRIISSDAPRAVYLHFHGGGMMTGTPEMMDIPNLLLKKHHDMTVVSVDYRLAPEYPWPAGPDDGVAVAKWILENGAAEFGSSRILIGGESAGAYMTAAVALRMRDELDAIDRVDGLNLVFGVYDWGRTPSQHGLRPHHGYDVLNPEGIDFFTECYLPGRTDDERRAPEISPLYAELAGLPPSLMSVGTCDHLFDDTMLLAARAQAARVEVELVVLPEMPHAFMLYQCGITKAWAEATDTWFEARLAS